MSEVILTTEEFYPFGEIKDNKRLKVSVRRVVPFSSQIDYQRFKSKIQVLKSLRLECLVKLTRVLEDEGAFHLMYEYVPCKLRYHRYQQEELIRNHLQEISHELQSRHMNVRFEHLNFGVGVHNCIKYYLDIEHIEISREADQVIKQLHTNQINLVMECLAREPSSSRTEPTMEFDKELLECRLMELGSEPATPLGNRRLGNYKSMTNLNSITNNPLEMLRKIEDKLEMLKKQTKKYTPAMRETFKSKEHLRQTVKEYWKKEKIDCRKMSGHTIYTSMFNRKGQTPEKKEISEAKEPNTAPQPTKVESPKQISPTSPPSMPSTKSVKLQPAKPSKEPLSKRDFAELQKTEFQSFYRSKETYVHEFLNVLSEDDSLSMDQNHLKQHAQPAEPVASQREKSSTIYENGIQLHNAPNPAKFNSLLARNQSSLRSGEAKSGNRSAQLSSKFEVKTNELKERMAKAFKSRDEVQKTRKNSVQTQIGVRR